MSKRTSLSLSDIRNVFRLLNEMQELREDPRLGKQHLIQGMCDVLGARQGVTIGWAGFCPDGQLKLLEFTGGGWASREAAQLWEQLLQMGDWRGDPVLNRSTQIAGSENAFRRCELVSDKTYYSGDGYNLIAKTAGVDDTLVGWFRHREHARVTGLAFQRGWRERSFSPRQREILSLLVSEMRLLHLREKLRTPDQTPLLPPRLSALLTELLTGKSEKQIAATLGLSRHTVNGYIKDLYRRMEVQSRPELMAKFVSSASIAKR